MTIILNNNGNEVKRRKNTVVADVATNKTAVDSTESSSNSSSNNNKKEHTNNNHPYPLQSGIPPWPTILFLVVGLTTSFVNIPTLESLDELATIDVLTNRKFPQYVSLYYFGWIRFLIGYLALTSTFYQLVANDGAQINPNYLKQYSKLRNIGPIPLKGFGTLCPFTSMSWCILGIGFLLRGILCLAVDYVEPRVKTYDDDDMILLVNKYIVTNLWLLRITFILWELTGPFAMITSCVTKFAIWPMALKAQTANGGSKTHNLAGFTNQLHHNGNSILSFCEVALLGGIPVCWQCLSYAEAFAGLYMLFTWLTGKYYFGSPTTTGPQYIYFFVDTTLGSKVTTFAIALLCLAIAILYLVFSYVSTLPILNNSSIGFNDNDKDKSSPSLLVNMLFVLIGSGLVCRFQD